MSLPHLLAVALSLVSSQNPDPTFGVTAHPLGLLVLPLVGDEQETFTHVQFDAVFHPARRISPVAHLALTRLMADFTEPDDFEKSSIDRYTIELGARYRPWTERGWYAEGTLGYLIETFDSKWLEAIDRDWYTMKETSRLTGKVDDIFQQPYLMTYFGWASDPSKRLRWDLGIGLGYAILGGTEDLHDIQWTGNPDLADPDQSVDLFFAAPLVVDVNAGIGVNF